MSNSYYADTFKWMEDQSEQYINDINQLTNELNAMAAYMDQYDLSELQSAIGAVDIAAFKGVRVDQVSELIVDEHTHKAIQNYIAAVTELSKDMENGYDAHINIDINTFLSNVARKRDETYMAMAIQSDPTLLMMLDSYRWAADQTLQEENNAELSSHVARVNLLHDAMVAQGVHKADITCYNAAENMEAMLYGFDYAMQHGANINRDEMWQLINDAFKLAAISAVQNNEDVVAVTYGTMEAAARVMSESANFSKEDIKEVYRKGADLVEQIEGIEGRKELDKMVLGAPHSAISEAWAECIAERAAEKSGERTLDVPAMDKDAGFEL